jgi:hypothetical protein
MSIFLQSGQVEAHVARLTAIRAQLAGYAAVDGRAAEALPSLDATIVSLQQEKFQTPVYRAEEYADDAPVIVAKPDEVILLPVPYGYREQD